MIEDQLCPAVLRRRRCPGDHRPSSTLKASRCCPRSACSIPDRCARRWRARLDALGLLTDDARARNARLLDLEGEAKTLALTAIRPAFFCSGCPHNTSTVVPDGSAAMGATGCHGLAAFMPERRTMPTRRHGIGRDTVDRGADIRRYAAHVSESGRWNLYPFRPAFDPRLGRGQKQCDLQDPVQRCSGDDGRPARRRCAYSGTDRPAKW